MCLCASTVQAVILTAFKASSKISICFLKIAKTDKFRFSESMAGFNNDPDGLHGREFSDKIYIMSERFINKGFATSSVLFMKGFRNSCYADKINQMTVNYDGGVYKCTARDFNEKEQTRPVM